MYFVPNLAIVATSHDSLRKVSIASLNCPKLENIGHNPSLISYRSLKGTQTSYCAGIFGSELATKPNVYPHSTGILITDSVASGPSTSACWVRGTDRLYSPRTLWPSCGCTQSNAREVDAMKTQVELYDFTAV